MDSIDSSSGSQVHTNDDLAGRAHIGECGATAAAVLPTSVATHQRGSNWTSIVRSRIAVIVRAVTHLCRRGHLTNTVESIISVGADATTAAASSNSITPRWAGVAVPRERVPVGVFVNRAIAVFVVSITCFHTSAKIGDTDRASVAAFRGSRRADSKLTGVADQAPAWVSFVRSICVAVVVQDVTDIELRNDLTATCPHAPRSQT